jgi:hypothetical protein
VGIDAIFLGDGHVDQIIVAVGPNKIQAFLEFGAETSTETITFLRIGVSMIACILAQVVEELGVLEYGAVSLGKS